jgi:hypothetical protein
MAEAIFYVFRRMKKKTFHQFIREANTYFALCALLFALCSLLFGFNSKARGRDHRL